MELGVEEGGDKKMFDILILGEKFNYWVVGRFLVLYVRNNMVEIY